jgi:hypothetical protein
MPRCFVFVVTHALEDLFGLYKAAVYGVAPHAQGMAVLSRNGLRVMLGAAFPAHELVELR